MKMLKKKILLPVMPLLFVSVLFLLCPATAKADRFSNDDTGYLLIIEDDADLLSADEETKLVQDMKNITLYGNVGFKTIDYNSSTASSYAKDYYYDIFRNDSGMVFLIDMDNRQLYIACSGAIYKTITASKANTITDNVYRYASRGDYYGCAKETFSQALRLLEGQKIAEPMKHVSNAILSVIIAMLIFFVIITASSKTKRAGTVEIISGAKKAQINGTDPNPVFVNETKKYSPVQRSGGGGGGGFSGGGGGGGFSGGGGGHGF